MAIGCAVAITREELSAADLRREAARSWDAKAARRMLAIALVLDEQSREAAAEACGMDRQALRDCSSNTSAIAREFAVSLHERTVGKLLHKLRFRRLCVRPQHPRSDLAAQAAFKGASLT